MSEQSAQADCEFIVVGSDAGGGPLAANLAKAGFKVLLLEAGDDAAANYNSQVPCFHAFASEDEELSWNFCEPPRRPSPPPRAARLAGPARRTPADASGSCDRRHGPDRQPARQAG